MQLFNTSKSDFLKQNITTTTTTKLPQKFHLIQIRRLHNSQNLNLKENRRVSRWWEINLLHEELASSRTTLRTLKRLGRSLNWDNLSDNVNPKNNFCIQGSPRHATIVKETTSYMILLMLVLITLISLIIHYWFLSTKFSEV